MRVKRLLCCVNFVGSNDCFFMRPLSGPAGTSVLKASGRPGKPHNWSRQEGGWLTDFVLYIFEKKKKG